MTISPPKSAQSWATLRIAATTLLVVALMNAGVGQFGRGIDAMRVEQIRIAEIRVGFTDLLADLEARRPILPAARDAVKAAAARLQAEEDPATVVELAAASDLTLAGIDGGDAAQARSAYNRLQKALAGLDRRCQTRAANRLAAMVASVFATLLLSAAGVACFAARYQRRAASLAALEVRTQSSGLRERRFRFLLEVEEATQDTGRVGPVVGEVMELLARFLGAPRCDFERVDRAGQTLGGHDSGLPRLDSEDLANLRAGRSKTRDGLLRCPLMREGELRAVVTARGGDGRVWSHDEIALVEETTARCGAYVERARAVAAIRRSEERLRFVLDASNDGVWERAKTDADVAWSGRMYAMLGLSPASFAPTFEAHRSLIHPEDLPRFDEALAGDAPYCLRLRIRRNDGEYLQVLAQGRTLRAPSGKTIRTVGTITDLTSLFEAEEAKQRIERQSRWSAALLDAQMNASIDGIIVVDPEHRHVLQNVRMAKVWGLPLDVIDGEDYDRQFDLVCDAVKDREAFVAAIRHVVEHPEAIYRDEIELKNGTILDRYSGPAVGSDGTVYGRIWTFRDITEHVRSKQALREAQEDLEARVEERTRDLAAATQEAESANAAKSEFLSRMSHELRTPLNAILGFGQILDREPLDKLQKESVHYILKGGRHLLGLINEILDLSRVESGHAELSIEPVPLAEVLVESLAMIRTMAADRDVHIGGLDDLDDLHVVADRQRLKQVLINLLSNAVKYNRPGGHVSARVRREGERLRISIEDTGCGIPPEGLAKLFTPFERLEAAASGVEGTGLGLFLTQKLVETMGGALTVESRVGEGSTFSFSFEIAKPPAEAFVVVEGDLEEPESSERVYSILSIEDNSANIRLLEAVLAHRGDVALTTAGRGMEGFEMARRNAPDLILLDWNLPDVSGGEVLARLQRSATTSGIPVFVVTADATEQSLQSCLRSGAVELLTKPLDVDRFLRAVDGALRGERREAA